MSSTLDVRHLAYSPSEAGARVGLSRERIRQHIVSGSLPAKRDGRRYLITHDALERWVEGLPPVVAPTSSLPAATSAERQGPASETEGNGGSGHATSPNLPAGDHVVVPLAGSDALIAHEEAAQGSSSPGRPVTGPR